MTPATSPLIPNIRTHAGRLLTMAGVPSDLVAGQVLMVHERTVVTPEVRDYLRRRQVSLQRGGGVNSTVAPAAGVAASATAETGRALQVWWHGSLDPAGQAATRGSATRWLSQIDPRVAGPLQAVTCSRELADQVAARLAATAELWGGPTQLVISPRPWEIQRELAQRHGTFAWCVMSGGPLGWEQARASAAPVLIGMPPLTSWVVRQWLTMVQPVTMRKP